MIGSRIGSARSLYGGKVGSVTDDESDCQGPAATVDGTTQRYVPQTLAEWTSVMTFAGLATGNPFAAWNFTEAATPIADIIGAFPLTVAGTAPTFQSPVADMSRTGILLADNATTTISNNSASFPDIASESVLVLMYKRLTVSGAKGGIAVGTANRARLETAAPSITGAVLAAFNPTASVTAIADSLNQTRPYILQVNRTGTVFTCFSDQEVITPTWDGTIAGKFLQFGNAAKQCAAGTILYGCVFRGSAAELTQAQVRKLLQALGWKPLW